MATTTNYGWTTPDDTALVKDGAAAIRTLGSSIDTTTKNLNPSTTLGDIEYRSSTANTNTRLGIGTTGQVLTVSGGVPAWATSSSGGMTLLSTTTLSGATVTISGISASYTDLQLYIFGMTNATTSGTFKIQPNGSSSITNNFGTGNSTLVAVNINTNLLPFGSLAGDVAPEYTSNLNAVKVTIENYASTTAYKTWSSSGTLFNSNSLQKGTIAAGGIQTTSAISSLVFLNDGGNLSTGTVLLYGVK